MLTKEEINKKVKEAVIGTTAKFSYACSGVLYYTIEIGKDKYQFPIDMNNKSDVGTASFEAEYRGITLMRYIRKAIEKEDFLKINR